MPILVELDKNPVRPNSANNVYAEYTLPHPPGGFLVWDEQEGKLIGSVGEPVVNLRTTLRLGDRARATVYARSNQPLPGGTFYIQEFDLTVSRS